MLLDDGASSRTATSFEADLDLTDRDCECDEDGDWVDESLVHCRPLSLQ